MKTFKCTLLLCIAACLITISEAYAQPSVALGGKIGASFSGFRGDDAGDVSFRKGVAGGLFVAISPAGFFTIQPELLFQQRGAVSENKTLNIKSDVKIGYMNIPVLFKLRLPIAEKFYPHVYIGPQFSYKLKSETSIEAFDLGTITSDINLRNYDLGGVFGFGLDVEINHLFLTVDFRYALGALDIEESDDFQIKNKDLSIMAGAGFKF